MEMSSKVLKFSFAYALYVVIVLSFDYLYMPWLAIKFRYLAIIPLYFSIFAVSCSGFCYIGLSKMMSCLWKKLRSGLMGKVKIRQ